MANKMTIDELVARVEILEKQMVKMTINTETKPVVEKVKKEKKVKKQEEKMEEPLTHVVTEVSPKTEKKVKKDKNIEEPPTPVVPEASPEPEKKVKKDKDPNKPKRKLSAYNMFAKMKRDEVKNIIIEEEEITNGMVSTTAVMQRMAKMWNELSDEEKNKYKELIVDDE